MDHSSLGCEFRFLEWILGRGNLHELTLILFPHKRDRLQTQRSIYGLSQAPRAWNKRLSDGLKLSGFQPLINAEIVFSSVVDESVVYLIIYVDEILVVAALESVLTRVKNILEKLYEIKDLGNAEYFLRVKIEREHKQVKLTQESYTRGVLERYNMLESKPITTPMVQSSDLIHKSPCSEYDSKRMIGADATRLPAASGARLAGERGWWVLSYGSIHVAIV
jgi:hypothetical protein